MKDLKYDWANDAVWTGRRNGVLVKYVLIAGEDPNAPVEVKFDFGKPQGRCVDWIRRAP